MVAGANVSAIARSKWAGSVCAYVASQGNCLGCGWRRLDGARLEPAGQVHARFEAIRSDTVEEIVIGDVVVRAGGDVEPDRLADVIRPVRKA